MTTRTLKEKLQTRTPGHNDKWDTGNINDDRDTQREIRLRHQDTGNINDDQETGTQLQRGRQKGTWGIYK